MDQIKQGCIGKTFLKRDIFFHLWFINELLNKIDDINFNYYSSTTFFLYIKKFI